MKDEAKKEKTKSKKNAKNTQIKPKKKVLKKAKARKKQENKYVNEKNGQYTKYEEFHIDKQLNKVFKGLMVISAILSILVILKNKDICMEVFYAKCGIAYDIVTLAHA